MHPQVAGAVQGRRVVVEDVRGVAVRAEGARDGLGRGRGAGRGRGLELAAEGGHLPRHHGRGRPLAEVELGPGARPPAGEGRVDLAVLLQKVASEGS